MKILQKASKNQIIVAVAGTVAAGFVIWFLARRAGGAIGEAAATVGEKLNPASPNNFVYDNVVNGLGSVLTGDNNFDFGRYLYDGIDPQSWSLFGRVDGKLNPASPNNIPYKATNYVGSAISGKPNFDLGIWVYDLFNSDDELYGAKVNSVAKPAPVIEKVNPASTNNFVYTGVNSVGKFITGKDNFDLGIAIYDFFN